MASGTNPNVRFVKCPRCLKVLLEDEDVPVYQCGGCSIILQAKKQNISANGTPSSADPGGLQLSGLQRLSEVDRATSSSPDTVAPSSGEISTRQEHRTSHDGSVDSIEEKLAGVRLSKAEQTDDIQLRGASAIHHSQNGGGEISRSEADHDTEVVAVTAERVSSLGSSSADHVMAARETTSSVDGSPKQRAESSTETLVASPDEEEHRRGNDDRVHPHGGSTDELQSGGDLLAGKAFSAYDGSVSSSDGREDQLRDGQRGFFESVDNSARLSLEGRVRGKSVMQHHSENKEQGTRFSLMSSEEKHNGTRRKKLDQNTALQAERSGDRLGRHWRRQGTHEFGSYMPYYQKGPSFSSAYEHGSPSYRSRGDFDSHSRAYSLQMPPYGRHMHSRPGFDPMYHNTMHTTSRDWGQTNRASRIPFSGESVVNRRHQVTNPNWYQSHLHTSYGSYPGSPQRHTEPEYHHGWSREIVSDVEDRHRRGRREVQTYPRERKPVAKRHVRPTAGGAPYTICYHCSQTLQMPADFLILKRKYHLLRCGACMNVLRFSLQDGTHLVPDMRDPRPESSHDINVHGKGHSASGSSRNEVPKPKKRSSSAKNEELPVARGSPLHRLMGYSTVSQVFKVSQRPPSLRISDSDQTLKN